MRGAEKREGEYWRLESIAVTDFRGVLGTKVYSFGASAINCCCLALISFKLSRLRPVSATGEVVGAIIDCKCMRGRHLSSSQQHLMAEAPPRRTRESNNAGNSRRYRQPCHDSPLIQLHDYPQLECTGRPSTRAREASSSPQAISSRPSPVPREHQRSTLLRFGNRTLALRHVP